MKNSENTSSNYSEFGKKILENVSHLHPFVKQRLFTAESTGIIPKNMYRSSGIIDDAIVNLFDKTNGKVDNNQQLKIELFKLVNESLEELFKNEEFHKDTLSINEILDRELEKLDESYEMDVDWDLMMPEDLDDISYHQNDRIKPKFLYDDAEQNIIQTLEIYDPRGDLSDEKRMILNKIYNWLPFETSSIVDLFVFGKLNYSEIAQIKNIESSEVKQIIQAVQKSFRKNLN